MGLAQTGTGKTAAFGLPLLHQLDLKVRQPQSLILCPTRELCMQITNDLKNFSKYLGDVNIVPVYGGTSIGMQLRDLKRGAHVIVATPAVSSISSSVALSTSIMFAMRSLTKRMKC